MALTKHKTGQFIGVGVGPGDPELLTLKAYRLIKNTKVVSYLCNQAGDSQAKQIACLALDEANASQINIAIAMPMSVDRRLANQAYDVAAKKIRRCLDNGDDVVFLCEGDPLFFGSFSYLLSRLETDYCCQVVPGIATVNAASAVLQKPLVLQSESYAVISGRHSDDKIEQALLHHDSLIIMKAGVARPRILALLEKTNRLDDAYYLEYIGRENEARIDDVRQLENRAGPYFSVFVILKR